MKKVILISIPLVFLCLTAFYFYETRKIQPLSLTEPTPVACTKDAKVCPDGSVVGRTGQLCEFSDCPDTDTVLESTTSITTEWSLGESGMQNGVMILPTSLVEDNRCPVDIECIEAGVVRVRTILTKGDTRNETILSLGSPVSFQGRNVILRSVLPATESKVALTPEDYRFYIVVEKEITATDSVGTLLGHMGLVTHCPDNGCPRNEADYAKHPISVYSQDQKTLITTLVPDSDGLFTTKLPTGTYYIELAEANVNASTTIGLPATLAIENLKNTNLSVTIDPQR